MRTESEYREERQRLGIVSGLDQFLETRHAYKERVVMATNAGITRAHFENLYILARGSSFENRAIPSAQDSLQARLNLTLAMAGAYPRDF